MSRRKRKLDNKSSKAEMLRSVTILNRLKEAILSKRDLVILVLEFLVLGLAGAKLFILSVDQTHANRIFSEVLRRNTITLEAFYENDEKPNPELLKEVRKDIEGASTELIRYLGNRLPSCYFREGTISGSNVSFKDLRMSVQRIGPASALHNADLANNITKPDGSPCDSPSLLVGIADSLSRQARYGNLIEYAITAFGALLFFFKVKEYQIGRRFPVRRRNEQGMPKYIR